MAAVLGTRAVSPAQRRTAQGSNRAWDARRPGVFVVDDAVTESHLLHVLRTRVASRDT